MPIAITREVSPNMHLCELTHLAREVIDVGAAKKQHAEYVNLLIEFGFDILSLPAEPDYPDSVFVEDAAVVFDELAVIMRPGAESRRGEVDSIAQVLEPHRDLRYIETPGTLDGGDVLRVGKSIYVGVSERSNQTGISQLKSIVADFGYTVSSVEMQDCLHLKSAVTQVGKNTLLINPEWVNPDVFSDFDLIEVDPSEPFGANALLLGEFVVYPSEYLRTQKRLQDQGIELKTVDVSEIAKAEGGVTCCSLIINP